MSKYPMEWRYFSGRMEDGVHFHYAEFRKRDRYFRHWSVNGKFYEDMQEMGDDFHIKTPQFDYLLFPTLPAIEHKIPGKEYISFPKLTDGKVEVWFDHEQILEPGSNWEWLGCNLNCGMTIMAYWPEGPEPKYCDLTFNGITIPVKCMLDGRHFFIYDTGMYLMADDTQLSPPTTQGIIHKPKYGRPYSEWSFDVISKGGVIGKGIREKTFKGV
jgi:hypothetical protein